MAVSENIEVNGGQAVIRVNPKTYPIEAVYSAAYVFMDKAYIVLDGDPEKEILVKMRLKSGESPEEAANEFNNELINYSDYLSRARETRKLRETVLQRALLSNDPEILGDVAKSGADIPDFEDEEGMDIEDPEGIAIPWEEKYGKEEKGGCKKDESNTEQ